MFIFEKFGTGCGTSIEWQSPGRTEKHPEAVKIKLQMDEFGREAAGSNLQERIQDRKIIEDRC